MIRSRPSLRFLCTAMLAAGVLAVLSGLGEAAPARVTITVKLGSSGAGTFTITGGLTDAGRARATRRVVGGRLQSTQTLTGAKGTFVISSAQACSRSRGTWKLVTGGGGYRGASGGGATTGRIGCTRPFKASTVLHSGLLTVPPPALATPGSYRGWTSQDQELSFEVAGDGRSLVRIMVGGYSAGCVNQNGLRRDESSSVDQAVAGPVPIEEDRTFTFQVGNALRPAKVSGRFASATATGTIAIKYGYELGGHVWTCSAEAPWTVNTPAPPPRQAVAGKYCGITPQGEGICLDVPAGGRELRNLNVGIPLVCGEVGFLLRLTVDGPVLLHSDLSFQTSFTQPLGNDGSARVFLSGAFDRAGSMAGRITLQQPSFTHEGTRYTCRNGGAAWTAKLQS